MTGQTFFTKRGYLTPRAMACGYIHKMERDDKTLLFEQLSPSSYGVTLYARGASGAVTNYGATLRDGIAFYESFESINEARASYARLAREKLGGLTRRWEAAPDVNRLVIV